MTEHPETLYATVNRGGERSAPHPTPEAALAAAPDRAEVDGLATLHHLSVGGRVLRGWDVRHLLHAAGEKDPHDDVDVAPDTLADDLEALLLDDDGDETRAMEELLEVMAAAINTWAGQHGLTSHRYEDEGGLDLSWQDEEERPAPTPSVEERYAQLRERFMGPRAAAADTDD